MSQFLIWSFEHDGWWRPGGFGYTKALSEAGHFTADEAKRIVMKANVVTSEEQVVPLADAATFRPPPSYSCPRCRRRSFNPNDVRERYCGACHRFEEV